MTEPTHKSFFRRVLIRVLHLVARGAPGAKSLRPLLHRWRGVTIGKNVWIGDGVYLESEHPDLIELHDGANLSMRCLLIAHTRGVGRIIVERDAFIGPCSIVIAAAGKTLRIGAGAVISAGSVIMSSVPAGMVMAPPRTVAVARARVPFASGTVDEFMAGLEPLRKRPPASGPT